MSTKTEICNDALIICCIIPSIDDVDNDDTNEAIACRAVFNQIRDLLMEKIDWPFLTQQIDLQVLEEDPNDDWAFTYAYPNNVKRIQRIINPGLRTPQTKEQKIPFRIIMNDDKTRGIWCDEEEAIAEVNIFQDDPEFWPAYFVEPLAKGIAARICGPLKVDANLKVTIINDFNTWLAEAVNAAQSERQDDPEAESQFVQART